jgi:hypothetical protein
VTFEWDQIGLEEGKRVFRTLFHRREIRKNNYAVTSLLVVLEHAVYSPTVWEVFCEIPKSK